MDLVHFEKENSEIFQALKYVCFLFYSFHACTHLTSYISLGDGLLKTITQIRKFIKLT